MKRVVLTLSGFNEIYVVDINKTWIRSLWWFIVRHFKRWDFIGIVLKFRLDRTLVIANGLIVEIWWYCIVYDLAFHILFFKEVLLVQLEEEFWTKDFFFFCQYVYMSV